MIISHKYKFIFIKTRKTAGTSLEVFLSGLCDSDDIVTPIYPHVEPHRARNHKGFWNPIPDIMRTRSIKELAQVGRNVLMGDKFYNHIDGSLVKSRIDESVWNSYFKFCIERNPWDKTLSHFHMIKDRTNSELSLDQYLASSENCLNYHLYTDRSLNVLVDKVIKYEKINDELGNIFEKLQVPFDGSLGVKAKSGHRKDKRDYREILSISQKNIITEKFRAEIELHGYTFD